LHPTLEKLEAEGLNITYIHYSEDPDAFAEAGIRSTPSLVVQDTEEHTVKGYGFLTESELRRILDMPSE